MRATEGRGGIARAVVVPGTRTVTTVASVARIVVATGQAGAAGSTGPGRVASTGVPRAHGITAIFYSQ